MDDITRKRICEGLIKIRMGADRCKYLIEAAHHSELSSKGEFYKAALIDRLAKLVNRTHDLEEFLKRSELMPGYWQPMQSHLNLK